VSPADRPPRPGDASASRGVVNSGGDGKAPKAVRAKRAVATKSPADASGDRTGGRHPLGREAEAFVARELERRGFSVLGRNVRVGRLELDLIARRGSLIVICEVRARRSDKFMAPAESLDRRKLERIRRAASLWLVSSRLRNVDVRLDVAAVVYDSDTPRLEYYENAF